MEAHVADFGIAKNIQPARTHTSTHVMGTIGYIDPEYAQTSRLNEKSDVYSFGIVLLELLTNKMAVDDEVNLLDWVYHSQPFSNWLVSNGNFYILLVTQFSQVAESLKKMCRKKGTNLLVSLQNRSPGYL